MAIGVRECTGALLACKPPSCSSTTIALVSFPFPPLLPLLTLPGFAPSHTPGVALLLRCTGVGASFLLLLRFVWIALGVSFLLPAWSFFLPPSWDFTWGFRFLSLFPEHAETFDFWNSLFLQHQPRFCE